MQREQIVSRAGMVQATAKTVEAAGLLAMLKPFFSRKGNLTAAEQDVFFEIIEKVTDLAHATADMMRRERWPEIYQERALRKTS